LVEHRETYRIGLGNLNEVARSCHGAPFSDLEADHQDTILRELEAGDLPGFEAAGGLTFFQLMRAHLQEGLFADPLYGGNRDKLGWQVLGHPGVWLENSAEENLSDKPVDKRGVFKSLADVRDEL
jgi:gluconate 2-dehydrogenase alpha chain